MTGEVSGASFSGLSDSEMTSEPTFLVYYLALIGYAIGFDSSMSEC